MIAQLNKGVGNECMLWTDPSLGQRIRKAEMADLCAALTVHGGVTTLSLSGNTVCEEATNVLAAHLREDCKALRVLDLSFCGVNGASLTKVVAAIQQNTVLRDVLLNASFNDIQAEGAASLASVLGSAQSGSGLRHLVLRYNQLHSKGVAQLVRNAHTLSSLDCSYAGNVDAIQLAAALKLTKCKVVRVCGADFSGAQAKMLMHSAPKGCLVLDEDAESEAPLSPPKSVRRGSSVEVEDAMWLEELALLHRSKSAHSSQQRSAPAISPPPGSHLTCEDISPTASSPPRAASSPLASHTRALLPQYSPPGQSPKPIDQSGNEATIKSLSLALNVLHDSCSTVMAERDAARKELEEEKGRRAAVEKEAKQLKREMNQMRDDFAAQVHRLTRESTHGHGGGGGGGGAHTRDPSPQARRTGMTRTASPRSYSRTSTLPRERRALGDVPHNTHVEKSPHKKAPMPRQGGKTSTRTPCKSPSGKYVFFFVLSSG